MANRSLTVAAHRRLNMIRPPTCPICGAQLAAQDITDSPLFPFCSARCKQIDLLRWCKGEYAVVDQLTPEELLEQQYRREAEEL